MALGELMLRNLTDAELVHRLEDEGNDECRELARRFREFMDDHQACTQPDDLGDCSDCEDKALDIYELETAISNYREARENGDLDAIRHAREKLFDQVK